MKYLNLSYNNLHDETAKAFQVALSINPTLLKLNLRFNTIDLKQISLIER